MDFMPGLNASDLFECKLIIYVVLLL